MIPAVELLEASLQRYQEHQIELSGTGKANVSFFIMYDLFF